LERNAQGEKRPIFLRFGVRGVGFYFFDLVGVAFAVGGDQEEEFVGVPLLAVGAVGRVVTEAGRGLEESFGCGAAFDEVVDGGLRRAEAVGGLYRFGRLDFVLALGDVGDDPGVNCGDVAAWDGGSFHDTGFDQAADVVFGGGDVFHAFGDGPAIGSGFEVPLGGGEAPGSVEDVFFSGFEICESFVFFGWGNFLGAGGEREEERTDECESDTGFSDHFESSLAFLKFGEAAECRW
jgi:hypothetical protein